MTDVIQDVKNMPNRGSLCVMGRFGYDFVNHEARIRRGRNKALRRDRPPSSRRRIRRAERSLALDREEKTMGLSSPQGHERRDLHAQGDRRPFQESPFATSGFYHTGRVLEAYRRMGLSYPYEYDRLLDADLIIIAGANLLSNNHVLGDRVRDAYKLRGSRIMVVDPAPSALTAIADAHLEVLPGSDGALFDASARFSHLARRGRVRPPDRQASMRPAERAGISAGRLRARIVSSSAARPISRSSSAPAYPHPMKA